MEVLVRELSRSEGPALERHFLLLQPEDRRLRFGVPLADAAVREYVARIDFERAALFGVADDELQLLGAGHLARADAHAELGVSV
ncbi:MAG: GNAT family N-acetyltransferase, partial [Betaproteobacteria bacterium]|nr:GNAT family N-acetyltransferase [Betaproteobacteria bacterium]